jgi:hypothetical protein
MPDDIDFEASEVKKLDQPQEIDQVAMVRKAQDAVKYGNIKEKVEQKNAVEQGKPTEENQFPPDLVIDISKTAATAITCERFIYDDREAKITAETITLWFPYMSRKWYLTITSLLIFINKMMKCIKPIGSFMGVRNPIKKSVDKANAEQDKQEKTA